MQRTFLVILMVTCTALKAFTGQYSEFPEISMAVIDFEGIGLNQNESIVITDKFRDALLENKKCKILERYVVTEVLKEQGFQQTGACNSNSCLVEAGQLLGVQFLVAGRVTQTSGMYAFSVRLIDVSTGAIVTAINRESRNEFGDFLSTDIPGYSATFYAKISKQVSELASAAQVGMVFVESKPTGGEIIVDGKPTGRTAPATLSNIAAGPHLVEVVNKELFGSIDIVVTGGQLAKCSLTLKRGVASLVITSNPENAEVIIDGNLILRSPLQLDSIEAGNHTVQLRLRGYRNISETLFLVARSRIVRSYPMEPLSYLRFDKISSGTNVMIDGAETAVEVNKVYEIKPGQHALSFLHPAHKDTTIAVRCQYGDTVSLSVDQTLKNGILNVNSLPPKAVVRLSNGVWVRNIGVSPLSNSVVTPGNYQLTLLHQLYEPSICAITIKPSEVLSITDTLSIFKKEYVEWQGKRISYAKANLLLSGVGTYKMDQPTAATIFFTAGLVSDFFLGVSTYQTCSHYLQKRDATLAVARDYYQKRQVEDQIWAVSTLSTSVILRLCSYFFTTSIPFQESK